ncbi:hypothetical protein IFO70_10370 [Phormidium tenue FACHB-886]|nr:hypothetical protein [Phormidium tenue FACHB-886]
MELSWNPPKISKTKATYTWGNAEVDYAAVAHEGGVARADGTETPARPWTEAAIEETDLAEAMQENYQRTGDIGEAFDDTAHYLAGQFEFMIRDERWAWDRPTKRSNGTTAGSPRSIVDSGKLAESQDLQVE